MARRKDGTVERECIHHLKRPAAVDDIEDRSAGSVRNFGGEFAGEAEAHVVLGQEHPAYPLEILRLMVAHPQQLGKREAGQDRVGGVPQHIFPADFGVDEIHLSLAALVAPDERRTDHGAGIVKDHQAMHLAGEADAAHLRALHAAACQHTADGDDGSVPPVLGSLLRPERALHVHLFVRRREARADAAALIHKKRARAAGTDIDSQPHDPL